MDDDDEGYDVLDKLRLNEMNENKVSARTTRRNIPPALLGALFTGVSLTKHVGSHRPLRW